MISTLFQWRSLKTRVAVFTLIIFVIGVWSLAFYASRMLRGDMEKLLGEQQFATVSFIAGDVNDELSDRLDALERIAKEIDAPMMATPAALQARLEQRPLLQLLFNAGAIIYRPDGTAIADVPLSVGRVGNNYMDIDSVAAALKDGKSTISKPVIGKKLGGPVFGMTVPIRDDQGKVIGALGGVINLGKPNFLDKLTQNRYGKTGGYLLIAPQHQLFVTATDKSRIMQPLPAPGLNAMLDRYMQGYTGFGVAVNSRGVLELSAAKDIPAAGWFIVGVLPAQEAFAPIRDMQQRMLWATLLLTLLVGGLTWRMLHRELAPMLNTAKILGELAESNKPPHALPITRQDETGALIGGFNRLLEALAQREAALRESEDTFRTLFETSSDGILLLDSNARFVKCNQNALDILKMTREQLLLLTPDQISTEFQPCGRRSSEYAPELLASTYQTGFARFDWTCVTSEGSEVIVEVCLTPITIGGQPLLHATWRDITERKQAEEALHQNTKALVRSNAELEQFAYVVSHDLRQPLRMVNSYVQLIERALADKLDDETREMMHFATDGARRMDQMLVSLLEYSRIGRKGEPLAPLASRAGVDEALLFLAPAIKEAGAMVRVAGDWPEVRVSRDEFTRLWQNLIGNALKYRAPDRNPEIDITVSAEADGWRFCIADNGIGIEPGQFDRLFKVFQRLHTRDQYEGTGIGLAVARKIVERHGGRIWVESAGNDRGCHFCFTLPKTLTAEVLP